MKQARQRERLPNRGCRSNNADVLAYCYCFSCASSIGTHANVVGRSAPAVSRVLFPVALSVVLSVPDPFGVTLCRRLRAVRTPVVRIVCWRGRARMRNIGFARNTLKSAAKKAKRAERNNPRVTGGDIMNNRRTRSEYF
jgi:hypothetical protein